MLPLSPPTGGLERLRRAAGLRRPGEAEQLGRAGGRAACLGREGAAEGVLRVGASSFRTARVRLRPQVAWSGYGELRAYADQARLNNSGAPGDVLPAWDVKALRRAYYASVPPASAPHA